MKYRSQGLQKYLLIVFGQSLMFALKHEFHLFLVDKDIIEWKYEFRAKVLVIYFIHSQRKLYNLK